MGIKGLDTTLYEAVGRFEAVTAVAAAGKGRLLAPSACTRIATKHPTSERTRVFSRSVERHTSTFDGRVPAPASPPR